MNSRVVALREILEQERNAALAADVDLLLELQEPKRFAIEALRNALQIDDVELKELSEYAEINLSLMRHLTHCLRGILSIDPPEYTARGQRNPTGMVESHQIRRRL